MVIDDLKILIDAVAGMEGTVIYVLLGYIIYQLVIFGGTTGAVVAILRLFILKMHNILITRKTVINEISINDCVIMKNGNIDTIKQAFSLVTDRNGSYSYKYMHMGDCEFLLQAVKEKIANDKKKEKERNAHFTSS